MEEQVNEYLNKRLKAPKLEDYIRKFHTYATSATTERERVQAFSRVWQEFNTQDNIFLEIMPTPESLIFAMSQYIPDRAKDEDNTTIGQPNQRVIKWDDTPLYDTVTNAFFKEYQPWSCAEWQSWHVALETHYKSTFQANTIWKTAWNDNQNYCKIPGVAICPLTAYCRIDCDMVKYLASKEVTLGWAATQGYCDLSDVVINLTGAAADVSQGIKNTASAATWVLPALGVVAVGVGIKKMIT